MFALKTIHLEKKVSNENQIILLFDLDSFCPCMYPMLYTMKFEPYRVCRRLFYLS